MATLRISLPFLLVTSRRFSIEFYFVFLWPHIFRASPSASVQAAEGLPPSISGQDPRGHATLEGGLAFLHPTTDLANPYDHAIGLNQTHCPILQSLCNRGQTITHIQSYTNQTTTHIQSYTGQTTTHIPSYLGQPVRTRLHLWTCNAPEEEAQQLRWQHSNWWPSRRPICSF